MQKNNYIKNYTAYLFDMDGTLVDSEKLKGKALVKTCAVFGGKVNVNEYKTVMGESWETVAGHFFKTAQIKPEIEEFNTEFKPIYKEFLYSELSVNKNAIEFLTRLKQKGKKIGVVSSAFSWMVNQVLTQLEIKQYFDVVVTQEMVSKHKPHPEAYIHALEKLDVMASETIIFEDSEAGLTAGMHSGCDVATFRHEFNVHHDFSKANYIISDYKELYI